MQPILRSIFLVVLVSVCLFCHAQTPYATGLDFNDSVTAKYDGAFMNADTKKDFLRYIG